MNATAIRLGHSPLTMDWTHFARASSAPQRGSVLDVEAIGKAWSSLAARFQSGEVGFYDAPVKNELSLIEESIAEAQKRIDQGETRDVLFLGIGGSALGPKAALQALSHRRRNPIRFHFLENPDPVEWRQTIRLLDPRHTLVVVVTKSGTTFETMAQALLALDWLGKDRWKTQVLAITDPMKGDLRAFATKNGIPLLSIPPSIGGRFSLFSPVGLFAMELAGLSATDLLLGARQVRDYVEKTPAGRSAFFILADLFLRNYPKRPTHVFLPYSSRLRFLADWFSQLWGESLGKDGKGFTPVAASGPVDQHSILQLLRDGPDDKVTLFVSVNEEPEPVPFPDALLADLKEFPSFSLLRGHSLHELVQTEYRATSLVLTKRDRPHMTLQLDRLDERSFGAITFALSCLTACTGALWQVNPFDQPGVEEGKIYIRKSLLGQDS